MSSSDSGDPSSGGENPINRSHFASWPEPPDIKKWQESDGTWRCVYKVKLLGGTERSFGGSGDTLRKAIITAKFNASYASKLQEISSSSDGGDSDGNGSGKGVDEKGDSDSDGNDGNSGINDPLHREKFATKDADAAITNSKQLASGQLFSPSASTSSSSSEHEDDDRGGRDTRNTGLKLATSEKLPITPSAIQPNEQKTTIDDEVQIIEEMSNDKGPDMTEESTKVSVGSRFESNEERLSSLSVRLPLSVGDCDGETPTFRTRSAIRFSRLEKKEAARRKSVSTELFPTLGQSPTPSTAPVSAPLSPPSEDDHQTLDTQRAHFAQFRTTKGRSPTPGANSPSQSEHEDDARSVLTKRKSRNAFSPTNGEFKRHRAFLVSPTPSPVRQGSEYVNKKSRSSPRATLNSSADEKLNGWNKVSNFIENHRRHNPAPIPRSLHPNAPLPLPHTNGEAMSRNVGAGINQMVQDDMRNRCMQELHHGSAQMPSSHKHYLTDPRYSKTSSASPCEFPVHHRSYPISHQAVSYPHATVYTHPHHLPQTPIMLRNESGQHQAADPHQSQPISSSVYMPQTHTPYQSHMIRGIPQVQHGFPAPHRHYQQVPNGAQIPSFYAGIENGQTATKQHDQYEDDHLKEVYGRLAREAAIKDASQARPEPLTMTPHSSGEEVMKRCHTEKAEQVEVTTRDVFVMPPSMMDESSDEESDGEDYISTLQMLVQRSKKLRSIKYKHESLLNENGAILEWQCKATLKLAKSATGEDKLCRTAEGRSKTISKRRAAKKVFLAYKEGENASTQEMPEDDAECTDAGTPDKVKGSKNVFGALNELWFMKVLKQRPDFQFSAVGGDTNLWKSTITLSIEEKGVVTLDGTGVTKKAAKTLVAEKGFEYLRSINVRGIHSFKDIRTKGSQSSQKGNLPHEIELNEQVMEAINEVIRISEGEEGEDTDTEMISTGLSNDLTVPEDYKLVIASTVEHCHEWIKQNTQSGTDVGVFIDSWSARESFKRHDADSVPDRMDRSLDLDCPLLCLSTEKSGLVLRADKCKDVNEKKKNLLDGFWIPEPVEDCLKDPHIRKHGHTVDFGAMRLCRLSNLRIRGMRDIAVASFNVSGFKVSDGPRILHKLPELAQHWLEKNYVGTKGRRVWKGFLDAPQELVAPGCADDETLGIGILSAYTCACLQNRIQVACENKRTRLYGSTDQFMELSKRLLQYPFE